MQVSDALDSPGARLRVAHGLYLSGDENLAINVSALTSTNVVTIAGRLRLPDGRVEPIRVDVPATNGRSVTTTVRVLGEGWLESLIAYVSSGSPAFGAAYVVVDLVRGLTGATEILDTLIAGYITARGRRRWPTSPIADALTGPGNLRVIAGTNPAAGVEISETVPTGARWRLRAISFNFVTSAVAANREVSIVLDDGTTVLFTSPSGFTHTASLTRRYSGTIIGAQTAPAQGTDRQILLPDLMLPAGGRIRTVTTAIDAGDDYSAPQYTVDEYLEAI